MCANIKILSMILSFVQEKLVCEVMTNAWKIFWELNRGKNCKND